MFESLGVDADVERAYLALLRRDHPGRTSATAITRLVDLGLATGEGESLSVIPPEQALQQLVDREVARLEARRRELETSVATVDDLVNDFVGTRSYFVTDQLERLTERGVVRSRLFQIAQGAQQTASYLHPGPGMSDEGARGTLPIYRIMFERGVTCRVVVDEDSLSRPHWRTHLTELVDHGVEVRVHPSVPHRVALVDDRVAAIPGWSAGQDAYILHGEDLVAPFAALFAETWLGSQRLTIEHAEAGPDRATAVTEERMRQTVSLLARGFKDEAIARRLGVSIRTLRRILAATLDELGAASRFQAGAEAQRRGWLSH